MDNKKFREMKVILNSFPTVEEHEKPVSLLGKEKQLTIILRVYHSIWPPNEKEPE